MKVQDLMSRNVESCRVWDDLNRPVQLMWDHDFGCVPVVDGTGAVVGVITDRDVCMASYTRGLPLSAIRVGDVISGTLESCSPTSTVEAALATMRTARVRRLPVIDGEGALVGMLSLCDLVQATDGGQGAGDGGLSKDLLEALCAVTEPRLRVVEVPSLAPRGSPAKPSPKKVGAPAL